MTIKNYALVNESNIVVNVVVIDDTNDESFFVEIAKAHNATQWLDTDIYGVTEINGEFDGVRLWVEKPYPSWVKGETNWVAPVSYPNDGNYYIWNEEILNWEEVSE
jgi:hypothetical protein